MVNSDTHGTQQAVPPSAASESAVDDDGEKRKRAHSSWKIRSHDVASSVDVVAEHHGLDGALLGATGATGAFQTIVDALPRNSSIVLLRDSHAAVVEAAILRDREIHYAAVGYDTAADSFEAPAAAPLERVLARIPGPAAVFAVATSRAGRAAALATLRSIAHAHHPESLLIGDARLEGLYDLHPAFPASAAKTADVVVIEHGQTPGALSGAAVLGWRGDRAAALRLDIAHTRNGGTMHSRDVTASIGPAIRALSSRPEPIERAIGAAMEIKAGIAGELPALDPLDVALEKGVTADPTCLNVGVGAFRISGIELARRLHAHDVDVAYADLRTLGLRAPLNATTGDVEHVLDALHDSLSEVELGFDADVRPPIDPYAVTEEEAIVSPTAASRMATRRGKSLPLAASVGQVSCETVSVAGQGAPLIVPGFRIGAAAVRYLEELVAAGGTISTPGGWSGEVAVAPQELLVRSFG
jgi:hypothetical protein